MKGALQIIIHSAINIYKKKRKEALLISAQLIN